MDVISHLNPIEKRICDKADYAQIPIAGNIELLPLCNMNCKMCYSRMTREEMCRHAPMHDYKDWIRIGKEASDMGTVFILLTGGEPFLYPNLKDLYMEMNQMGLILSMNTNGTLIDENAAKWLSEAKPRRLNITIYGASDETYGRLCRNPHGFTQLMKAIEILKAYDISIKFNCSITPDNIADLDRIYEISEMLEIPIEIGFYMFAPVRKNNINNVFNRLNPEDAAWVRFRSEQLQYGNGFNEYAKFSLEQYKSYQQTNAYESGYTCRAGNSVYWINYDGTMSACSFTNDFSKNVFEYGFETVWSELKNHVSESCLSRECHECKERILCGRCAAAAMAETGSISGTPQYYCDLTRRYIELLQEVEEKNEN